MLNKNNLFILISIILGFIISYYYIRKFDILFFSIFLIVSVIFYIIFYYLGNINTYENFFIEDIINDNYTNNDYINNDDNYINYNDMIDNKNYIKHKHSVREENYMEEEEYIYEEEYMYEKNNIHEENKIHEENNIGVKHNIPEEHIINDESLYRNNNNDTDSELSEETYTKPNLNNIVMSTPVSNGLPTGYNGPLNINISYNAQNSSNNLKNDGMTQNQTDTDLPNMPLNKNNNNNNQLEQKYNIDNNIQKEITRNLGPIKDDRIYNNSDWIYGNNAWTNKPDYYLPPQAVPNVITNDIKPLSEVDMSKYSNNNNVSPIEINTPWNEWKSGDSEPEPFNL
jgi:hypothetical protein